MKIDFRIREHSIRKDVRLVEIVIDGKVCGAIYAVNDKEKNYQCPL